MISLPLPGLRILYQVFIKYTINERFRMRWEAQSRQNSGTEIVLRNVYSSQLSFSSSCALGRSFGSNSKHLRKNAAVPEISSSSTASRLRKMTSSVVGVKLLLVWRSVPKWKILIEESMVDEVVSHLSHQNISLDPRNLWGIQVGTAPSTLLCTADEVRVNSYWSPGGRAGVRWEARTTRMYSVSAEWCR